LQPIYRVLDRAVFSGRAAMKDVRRITMAKRVSHRDSMCGVARPLDAIGDWWSLLIVRDAFDGLRRFGEFQKSLGLAKNILSARLRNPREIVVLHGDLHHDNVLDFGAPCCAISWRTASWRPCPRRTEARIRNMC